MQAAGSDILFERRGAAGIVTLNRPQALNAVTHGMVRSLRAQLDAWAIDAAVTRVVIQAAGERAFARASFIWFWRCCMVVAGAPAKARLHQAVRARPRSPAQRWQPRHHEVASLRDDTSLIRVPQRGQG